ncbi:glycoside hydrolase family 5 protein [archaeon]|nr:glycoside hydrolase family 5 protein [archaeon]
MKKLYVQFVSIASILFFISLNGCGINPSSTLIAKTPTPTSVMISTLNPTLTPLPTSIPKVIVSNSLTLQQGNDLPKYQFTSVESSQLQDNRLGQMNRLDDADFPGNYDIELYVHNSTDLGLKWVRLTEGWFDWIEVASTGDYSDLHVPPVLDDVVSRFLDEGVQIMYALIYWDEDINIGDNYYRFKSEEEIQRYIEFVRFTVNHYRGQVQYYELLNEPNILEFGTQQHVEVLDYIELARRIIPVIRQEDPDAKIVVGAVTPFHEPGAYEYLLSIVSSDIMSLVDGVSWHAGSGASPEYLPDLYNTYPAQVSEIMETAIASGFNGEFFAEELHWRTSVSPHSTEYSEYEMIPSAKYHARGIVMHLGMDITTGLALENIDQLTSLSMVIKNLSTVLAGAKPENITTEIQSEATNIRLFGFNLPDGDRLIALWTDGIAVNDDPGVIADLTIFGLTSDQVTGIDVLYGFEQVLQIENVGSNLFIRNLLIKDYPLILHINNTATP